MKTLGFSNFDVQKSESGKIFIMHHNLGELDPNSYEHWHLAARLLQHDIYSCAVGHSIFLPWSKQATTPAPDAEITRVYQSHVLKSKRTAEISEINSSIEQFGTSIDIFLKGTKLNPDQYDEWLQGAQVIHADATLTGDHGLQVFKLWSKQITIPGGKHTDAEIARAFHSVAPKAQPVAEILPPADNLTLVERLKLMLLPDPRRALWPGFNETINEAIAAIKVEVPVTPFDAATATTIELVQHGLLTDLQAAEILANHPAFKHDAELRGEDILELVYAVTGLQNIVHDLNVHAGWWSDLETGQPKERNDGELLILVISEIIEGFEGIRKNLMDDKLFTRKMIEVEIADAQIRLADYAGGRKLDVAGAILHKLVYNTLRQDHTIAHRKGVNGKKV